MEVQGRIKVIGETQTFGSNGFRKSVHGFQFGFIKESQSWS